jgi:site-specific recombinase XerD
MKVSQGFHCWQEYHKLHSKKTLKTYQSILSKLTTQFGERDLNSLAPKEIVSFLTQINQQTKQTTKRTRYSQLTSFLNFIIRNLDSNFRIPCETLMLKKYYRSRGLVHWTISKRKPRTKSFFERLNPETG